MTLKAKRTHATTQANNEKDCDDEGLRRRRRHARLSAPMRSILEERCDRMRREQENEQVRLENDAKCLLLEEDESASLNHAAFLRTALRDAR